MEASGSKSIRVSATDASGRRLRTVKSERTKTQLLVAARSVFEDRGYQEARVADITAAAGAAHGTFYRYFKSKEDVFRALAEGLRDSLLSAQSRVSIGDPEVKTDLTSDSLRRLVGFNMRSYLDDFRREARMIALLKEVSSFDPVVRKVQIEVNERLITNTELALQGAMTLGAVPVHPDLRCTARLIRSLVDAAAFDWYIDGHHFEDESAIDALVESWLRLAGISKCRPAGTRCDSRS